MTTRELIERAREALADVTEILDMALGVNLFGIPDGADGPCVAARETLAALDAHLSEPQICAPPTQSADITREELIAVATGYGMRFPTPPVAPHPDVAAYEQVGRDMVALTTTVRSSDEWPAIPELWKRCMEERDAALAKLAQPDRKALSDAPTNEDFQTLWDECHQGHPADFAADVLERWGGWPVGALGHGGFAAIDRKALAEEAKRLANLVGWKVGALDELHTAIDNLAAAQPVQEPKEPDEVDDSIAADLQNEFGLTYSILSKATLGSMLVDALRLSVSVTSARTPAVQEPAGDAPAGWQDEIEQRLLTWRQRLMNRSGDRLALDDFMDKESLADLIDSVCAPLSASPATPAAPVPSVTDEMVTAYLQANDEYWRRMDEGPEEIGVWRNGTPREATRVSLESALTAPSAQPKGGE